MPTSCILIQRVATRPSIRELDLRMTVKFHTAVGLVVAGIKALDLLVG